MFCNSFSPNMAMVTTAHLCGTPKTEASQFSFWRTFSSTSSSRSQGETCFRNRREQHIIKYFTSFQIITNIVLKHYSQPDSLLPLCLQCAWHPLHRPHWIQGSSHLSYHFLHRRWHHQCYHCLLIAIMSCPWCAGHNSYSFAYLCSFIVSISSLLRIMMYFKWWRTL